MPVMTALARPAPDRVVFIPQSARRREPWRNGGGATEVIASGVVGGDDLAASDWDWRASIATIAGDGPFSHFPGVDRLLALVDGPGLTLAITPAGADPGSPASAETDLHRLQQAGDTIAFAGEASVQAVLHGAPTRDFNLMARRDRLHIALDCVPLHALARGDDDAMAAVPGLALRLVQVLSGAIAAHDRHGKRCVAAAGDTLLQLAPAGVLACTVEQPGQALLARAWTVAPAAAAGD